MIVDIVLTTVIVLHILLLSFLSNMFIMLLDVDHKTKDSYILKSKNSCSIVVLCVTAFVLFLYCGYLLV